MCYDNDLIQFEGLPFREKFLSQKVTVTSKDLIRFEGLPCPENLI